MEFLKTLSPTEAQTIVDNTLYLLDGLNNSISTSEFRSWARDHARLALTLDQAGSVLSSIAVKDYFASNQNNEFYWMHPNRARDVIYKIEQNFDVWRSYSEKGNVHSAVECGCCNRRFAMHIRDLVFRMTPALFRELDIGGSDRICLQCATVKLFPKCEQPGCNRYDSAARFRPFEHKCSYCYRRFLEDTMYLTYRMTKQKPSPKVKPNILYSGCEIECYVDPKVSMNFNEKYVLSIKRDGSLTANDKGHPIELVTQPLLDHRVRGLTTICKELAKHSAKVDSTCGGHVHIEATTLNLNRQPNMEAVRHLFRVYESVFYAVTAPGRIESNYCYPVSWTGHPTETRYHSMNFCSYEKYGTLEFRCFGGSVEATKWLDRIDLCEGFVLFARDNLKLPMNTTANNTIEKIKNDWSNNYEKIQKFSEIDSGFANWKVMTDQYSRDNRVSALNGIIKAHGEALITLAGTRFGLANTTIDRLINYHKILWKKK